MKMAQCLVVVLSLFGSVAQAQILGGIVSEPLRLLEPAEAPQKPADVEVIVLELTGIDLRRQALWTYIDQLLDLQADEESACPLGMCNQAFLREIQARLDDARENLDDLNAQVEVVVFGAVEDAQRLEAAVARLRQLFETLSNLQKKVDDTAQQVRDNLPR